MEESERLWRVYGGSLRMGVDAPLVECASFEEAKRWCSAAPLAAYTIAEWDGDKTYTIHWKGWAGDRW